MGIKDYSSEEIVVRWDAPRCIHTGICTRTLPAVFDVTARPWIDVRGAPAEAVAATVAACPTGALRYERLDGGAAETAPDVTTITPMRNGPLYVRGRVRVTTPDGQVFGEETRVALCRCGATGNPPFCDNSHRGVGYRSPEMDPQVAARTLAAPAEGPASDPQTPLEICEEQEF